MLFEIDADLAEKCRIQFEALQARRARYEAKVGRSRHDRKPDGTKYPSGKPYYKEYEFIGWDGEAPKDTGYALFGSSKGHENCHPDLTTQECFDLLLQAKREYPYSIFVWFGGRYDWDEILRRSIPLKHLARLKNEGRLYWKGYMLTEIEGKQYSVSSRGTMVKIFEIHGWFHCGYGLALRKYGIGTGACKHPDRLCSDYSACGDNCMVCRIDSGKDNRANFVWADIDKIKDYFRLELELMPPLMEAVRKIVLDAGFNPRAWYGPSALARELLTKNNVLNAMAQCPVEVNDAACFAFAGGRFEFFRGGILGPHKTVDRNSAYMHAALQLPNLARGAWRKGRVFEGATKFALYHIRYNHRILPSQYDATVSVPYPLWRRLPTGNVVWARNVDNWFWTPEAELVKEDPNAVFTEAWIFDEEDENDRPFAFVRDIFHRRLVLQSAGSPAEAAIKWALAAIYGQLARAVGWDRKNNLPPKTHQIEWAGYITSHCRAAMHKVAVECGDKLISIDTDSVTAACNFNVPLGKALGEWKLEEYEEGVYFQNGIYFTRNGNRWSKGKTRGMERRNGRAPVTPELLKEAICTNSRVQVKAKSRYVTIKMGLAGQLEDIGKWRLQDANTLVFGGSGKRYHNKRTCAKYCEPNALHLGSGAHCFVPKPVFPAAGKGIEYGSFPHYLPWKHTPKPEWKDAEKLIGHLWVDTETLDPDDDWEARLIPQETIDAARKAKVQNRGLLSSLMRARRKEIEERERQHNGVPRMSAGEFNDAMARRFHPRDDV